MTITEPAELDGATITSVIPCSGCDGHGECGYEPPGWWHGSGVDLITWPCDFCEGDGEFTVVEP